jgi:hypothetical protein
VIEITQAGKRVLLVDLRLLTGTARSIVEASRRQLPTSKFFQIRYKNTSVGTLSRIFQSRRIIITL